MLTDILLFLTRFSNALIMLTAASVFAQLPVSVATVGALLYLTAGTVYHAIKSFREIKHLRSLTIVDATVYIVPGECFQPALCDCSEAQRDHYRWVRRKEHRLVSLHPAKTDPAYVHVRPLNRTDGSRTTIYEQPSMMIARENIISTIAMRTTWAGRIVPV